MFTYVVEFRDHTGERFPRAERQDQTRQRAQEIAMAYCRTYPTHMCFIYSDEEKPNGRSLNGNRKRTASYVKTEVRIFGEAYYGRRNVASTMMKKARNRTDRGEFQIPTIIARKSRTW